MLFIMLLLIIQHLNNNLRMKANNRFFAGFV